MATILMKLTAGGIGQQLVSTIGIACVTRLHRPQPRSYWTTDYYYPCYFCRGCAGCDLLGLEG